MLEWIGGPAGLADLALPLVGLFLMFAGKTYATPHRSWKYFAWGFGCWFAFTLVLRLEEGTLVSIPSTIGLTVGGLLWLSFLSCFGMALVTIWRDQPSRWRHLR